MIKKIAQGIAVVMLIIRVVYIIEHPFEPVGKGIIGGSKVRKVYEE